MLTTTAAWRPDSKVDKARHDMIQAAETSSIRQHARANPSIKREEPEEEPERSGPSDHRGHAERPLDKEADDAAGTGRCVRTADREAYRMSHYDRRIATTPDVTILYTLNLKEMTQGETSSATRGSYAETLMHYGLRPRAVAPNPHARGRYLLRR